jgi:muramoyltetrapeptide carboxypeptidase
LTALVFPPPLRAGDRVVVIAPSSPFDPQVFLRGLAWLRDRYRVAWLPDVLARTGYLAGSDARRAAELARALADREARAVFCARGGYGATRILADVPWNALRASPKWIVGFSDVTALHLEACAQGVASLHAAHVTAYGAPDVRVRAGLLAALERGVCRGFRALKVLHSGAGTGACARGVACGGNLALVEAMAAAGRLRLPEGAVLFLEDVTERPYRIDRMLTSLALGGHLARAVAVVFGDFDRCDPGPDGVPVEEVLIDRTRALGVPVLAGASFGHGAVNDPLLLGADVTVTVTPDGGDVRF